MVYVQQVEEEKLREREEYRNKKSKTENDFGQQKCGLNRPQGHAPSSPSAPVPKTKVSIMARIHRISRLDQPSPKVV